MNTSIQNDTPTTPFVRLQPAEQERIRAWARKLYAAGWWKARIWRAVLHRWGVSVTKSAVNRWVDEEQRRRHRVLVRRRKKADPVARAYQRAAERRSKKRFVQVQYQINPAFRLTHDIRSEMSKCLNGRRKPGRTMEIVGCTGDELKAHLESLFKPGMSWENRSEWHVDHKRPLASFDLSDLEQFKAAWHYTNLQPLWAAENIAKGATWN